MLMTASQNLKSAGFTKAQKARYLENETLFFLQKKKFINYIKRYLMTKNSFVAEVTFKTIFWMVNLISGWTKSGSFFPKPGHCFLNCQERVDGPPHPPPLVKGLIWKTFVWSSTSNHKTAYATVKAQVWQLMQWSMWGQPWNVLCPVFCGLSNLLP